MSDISKFTEFEKSEMLAKLAGLMWLKDSGSACLFSGDVPIAIYRDSGRALYQLSEMHNAQIVITWALCDTATPNPFFEAVDKWCKENAYYVLYSTDGFTQVLDVILKAAIENGMIVN